MRGPLFVTGCPRSGTTLLLDVLQGHSCVEPIIGETQYWESVYAYRRSLGTPTSPSARQFLGRYLATRTQQKEAWQVLDIEEWQQRLAALTDVDYVSSYAELMRLFAEKSLGGSLPDDCYPGTKNPKDLYYASFLTQAFPSCRVVNIVRDPRAVVASILNGPVGPDNLDDAALLWRYFAELGRQHARRLPVDQFLTIRYEDLVADVPGMAQRLCSFLDLPGEEQMGLEVSRIHSSFGGGKAGSVDPSRAERYRKVLSSEQIQRIESLVGSELEGNGYETVATPAGDRRTSSLKSKARYQWLKSRLDIKRSVDLGGIKGLLKPGVVRS